MRREVRAEAGAAAARHDEVDPVVHVVIERLELVFTCCHLALSPSTPRSR